VGIGADELLEMAVVDVEVVKPLPDSAPLGTRVEERAQRIPSAAVCRGG